MNLRVLLLLGMVSTSALGVSIVSDPTPTTTVTHCAWYVDSAVRELVAAPKDGTGKPYCSKDVSAIPAGSHTVTAAFVVQDAVWGEQEGPKSSPFVFARPSVSVQPGGLKLIP